MLNSVPMTANTDLTPVRDDIIGLLHRVGDYVLSGLTNSKNINTKTSDFDAVTEYDHGAEAMLGEHLRRQYPDWGIVGEEGSRYRPDAEFVWYIDPIDGTNNFSHGVPFFAVSAGLWQRQADGSERPVLGVLYDPSRDELFHGIAGQGAFSRYRGQERRLQVSQINQLDKAIVGTGFPYDRATNPRNNLAEFSAFAPHVQGLRRLGVASLDMTYVAASRFDIFWEYGLHSWDIAAAALFLQEAGGTLTTISGDPFVMQQDVEVASSNGLLHEQALAILARARGGRG